MIKKFFQSTNNPEAAFARFVLDEEKCNGCGACVAACPMQILMVADGKAAPNQRYDHFRCITCQNCVATCPNKAIVIEGDYRVGAGFWKNTHLFENGKTLPAPIRSRAGEPFEQIEGQLTETERVIYKRRSIRLYKKKAGGAGPGRKGDRGGTVRAVGGQQPALEVYRHHQQTGH